MVKLTKFMGLRGQDEIWINPDLVAYVEGAHSQTVIHFETGLCVAVTESPDKVIKILERQWK